MSWSTNYADGPKPSGPSTPALLAGMVAAAALFVGLLVVIVKGLT